MESRPAGPADFDAILDLNAESVSALSPLDIDRLGRLHSAAALHRVAQRDGGIAGFVLAFREGADYDSPNYRWFAQRYPRFLYVDRIVIAASSRGQGVGSLLYRDVMAYAAAADIGLVTCEIDLEPANPVSARFHAHLGFREVGRQRYGEQQKLVSLQVLELG